MDRREFLTRAGAVAVTVVAAPKDIVFGDAVEGQLTQDKIDFLNGLDCSNTFEPRNRGHSVTLELRNDNALVAKEDLFWQRGERATCKLLLEAKEDISFNHLAFFEHGRVLRQEDISMIQMSAGDSLEITMGFDEKTFSLPPCYHAPEGWYYPERLDG